MFYFHLFLVNIAVIVFAVAVEALNDILLLSPYTFLRVLPDKYIYFLTPDQILFFLVKPRDDSRWG